MLANEAWEDIFPNSYAQFMPEGILDHTRCVVTSGIEKRIHKRFFKFYNMWIRDPCFLQTMEQVWDNHVDGVNMYKVVQKLKALKKPLKLLNSSRFSNIEDRVKKANACKDATNEMIHTFPSKLQLIK